MPRDKKRRAGDDEESIDDSAAPAKESRSKKVRSEDGDTRKMKSEMPQVKEQIEQDVEPTEKKSKSKSKKIQIDRDEGEAEPEPELKDARKSKSRKHAKTDRDEIDEVDESTPDDQLKSKERSVKASIPVEIEVTAANISQSENSENMTIYLSGFPFDEDIKAYVMEHTKGVTAVRVHTWHDTGRSRGCAHVDYDSEQDLNQAMKTLHKAQVGSRYILAERANALGSKKSAPSLEEDSSRGGRRLFVKNIPYDSTEAGLQTYFSRFGDIKSVRIPQWGHTQNKKGFAYVEFEQKNMAVACVEAHRRETLKIEGRSLQIDYDEGKPKRGFKIETGRAWYKPDKSASPMQKKPFGAKRN